jgi:hypothetical protein
MQEDAGDHLPGARLLLTIEPDTVNIRVVPQTAPIPLVTRRDSSVLLNFAASSPKMTQPRQQKIPFGTARMSVTADRETRHIGGSSVRPLRRVVTLRDRWCYPARLVRGVQGAIGADDTSGVMQAVEATGKVRRALRNGSGGSARSGSHSGCRAPVRDGAVADLATGDRQLGNDHREAAGRRLAHLHP